MTDWNDDRGFGFIAPVAGGPRVFVHVSAFPRGRRPCANELVTYALARDERNRSCATDVLYVNAGRSWPTGAGDRAVPVAGATLFFTMLAGLIALGKAPVLLVPLYGLLSMVGLAMYGADKSAAQRGAWRIPEANLHAVALLGGWPGALVARRLFRHKTRKQPFVTIFWGTVVANCTALAWFVSSLPLELG